VKSDGIKNVSYYNFLDYKAPFLRLQPFAIKVTRRMRATSVFPERSFLRHTTAEKASSVLLWALNVLGFLVTSCALVKNTPEAFVEKPSFTFAPLKKQNKNDRKNSNKTITPSSKGKVLRRSLNIALYGWNLSTVASMVE